MKAGYPKIVSFAQINIHMGFTDSTELANNSGHDRRTQNGTLLEIENGPK